MFLASFCAHSLSRTFLQVSGAATCRTPATVWSTWNCHSFHLIMLLVPLISPHYQLTITTTPCVSVSTPPQMTSLHHAACHSSQTPLGTFQGLIATTSIPCLITSWHAPDIPWRLRNVCSRPPDDICSSLYSTPCHVVLIISCQIHLPVCNDSVYIQM